jgi:hypothetical protein
MIVLKLFLMGIVLLIGAIVLNAIATKLSIKTWYDFIQDPGGTNVVSYLWLFVIYPLCLGLLAFAGQKLFLN